jgi:orotidine-5'-phosphate decarboxylase
MNDSQRETLCEHLVVALDVETRDQAIALVEELGDRVRRYKIGARMFTRYGTDILDAVSERGGELFLDLKYHDIPNTVGGAVEAAAARDDIFMLTIHASGGRAMIRRAKSAAGEEGPSIVAVTALTSLDAGDVREISGSVELEQWAERLAHLAMEAGADGLVCSGQEVEVLRQTHGPDPLLVTPGIRPETGAFDDQKRAVTPVEALDGGSNFLVIGRPIYQADDPVAVVDNIAEDIS